MRQLGLSPLCGFDGDNYCLCFVNGAELTNEREAAIEDAAFVSCWMLPLAANEVVEAVSIEDSASEHSIEFVAHGHDASEVVACPLNGGGPSTAAV